MVHFDARPDQRPDNAEHRHGDDSARGAGRQRARTALALLRRSAMAGKLGLTQHAAGPGLAACDLGGPFRGGARWPSGEFFDLHRRADGVYPAMKRPADNQRGLAMLATLMAVALMTVLVVDFTYSASASFRSSANQINALRAAYLGRSGVNVGLGLLAQDARNDALSQQAYDGLDEVWAMPFPPLPVEGGAA